MNPVALCIVIVSCNTRDVLSDCITSIMANPPSAPFQIIVVDNHSADGSIEMLRERFPFVEVEVINENVGFSRANNIGICKARSPYILLLNSDTLVFPGTIDRLLHFMQTHDEAGIIGCRQLDGQKRLTHSWGKFPTLPRELIRKIIHDRLEIGGSMIRGYLDTKYSNAAEIDWVSGSCMMVNQDALREVGLLDERFFMYFEDIDWCERMRRAGWKVYYYPGAEIVHYGGVSADKNKEKVLIAYRESQLYFSKKYFTEMTHIILKSLLFLKTALNLFRLLVWRWTRYWKHRNEQLELLLRAHHKILQLLLKRAS